MRSSAAALQQGQIIDDLRMDDGDSIKSALQAFTAAKEWEAKWLLLTRLRFVEEDYNCYCCCPVDPTMCSLPDWLTSWRASAPHDADALLVEAFLVIHAWIPTSASKAGAFGSRSEHCCWNDLPATERASKLALAEFLLERASQLDATDPTPCMGMLLAASRRELPVEELSVRFSRVKARSPLLVSAHALHMQSLTSTSAPAAIQFARSAAEAAPEGHELRMLPVMYHTSRIDAVRQQRSRRAQQVEWDAEWLATPLPMELEPAEYMQQPDVLADVIDAACGALLSVHWRPSVHSAALWHQGAHTLWLANQVPMAAKVLQAMPPEYVALFERRHDCGVSDWYSDHCLQMVVDCNASATVATLPTLQADLDNLVAGGLYADVLPGSTMDSLGVLGSIWRFEQHTCPFLMPTSLPPCFAAAGLRLDDLHAVLAAVNAAVTSNSGFPEARAWRMPWCCSRAGGVASTELRSALRSVAEVGSCFVGSCLGVLAVMHPWCLGMLQSERVRAESSDLYPWLVGCTVLIMAANIPLCLLDECVFWAERRAILRLNSQVSTAMEPSIAAFYSKGGEVRVVQRWRRNNDPSLGCCRSGRSTTMYARVVLRLRAP